MVTETEVGAVGAAYAVREQKKRMPKKRNNGISHLIRFVFICYHSFLKRQTVGNTDRLPRR